MPEKGVFIDEQFFGLDSLRAYEGSNAALLFCRDWLNGNDTFSLQTSGSTGKPKDIIIGRDQMKKSAAASSVVLKPQPNDHCLLSLNPETIGGKMIIVRALEWSLNLTINNVAANPMQALSDTHTITLCSLVPMQLYEILQDLDSIKKLNRFRLVLIGGSAINATLLQAIQTLKPMVYHTYGMTETCSHVGLKSLNGPNPSANFMPLPGVSLSLNTDNTLIINAPFAIEQPLYTNDIAQIEKDGSFRIIGRKDRTVISGGIKIQLDEMEETLAYLIYPTPFFLFGIPDMRLGQKLMLFIEAEPFDKGPLLKRLKEKSPLYKEPKDIIFVGRFERTSSGKIDPISTSQKWARTN